MKAITLLFLTLLSPLAFAGNYATCLLDKLEGVQNDRTAMVAARLCINENPDGFSGVEWGSGLGFFARYDSPLECIHGHGRSVQSRRAMSWITSACQKLYGEAPRKPDLFDEFGITP